MKKVLLISVSALALSAGAAFAQATPIQSVSSNVSAQAPTTVSQGNESYIEQIGSNNTIGSSSASGTTQKVDNVSGSGNYSQVYQGWQGGPYYSNNATAAVTQNASGGGTNTARTVQYDGDQTSANGWWQGNYASTTQTITTTGQNASTIEQAGKNLVAIVNQDTAGATSLISQTGAGGSVNVKQTSANASSTINQSGAGTGSQTVFNVDVQQTGYSANTSGVSQTGDNGTITVQQSGALTVTNNSTVLEASAGSNATIIQDGTGYGYNTSLVNQTSGTGNQANVTQHANGTAYYENYSDIEQKNGGYASLTQTADLAGNWSQIVQDGASHAYVTQESLYAANKSTLTQTGSGNIANVSQGGH